MPNINIELPDELHKKLKVICAISSTTIKDFINNVLEKRFKEEKEGKVERKK